MNDIEIKEKTNGSAVVAILIAVLAVTSFVCSLIAGIQITKKICCKTSKDNKKFDVNDYVDSLNLD